MPAQLTQGGTYDATTYTYTSPTGVKQTRNIDNVPTGTKIIFSQPQTTRIGSGSGGASGSPSVSEEPVEQIPQVSATTTKSPTERLEESNKRIQDYYVSEINRGTRYTPEKLASIKKDFGIEMTGKGEAYGKTYTPRQFKEEGTGIRITPEGNLYGISGVEFQTPKIEPNLFGGESISPTAYALKQIKGEKMSIPTYIEYKYSTAVGYLSGTILRKLPESKFKSFLAGETYLSYLSTSIIRPVPITDTLKFAFFSPAMMSTISTKQNFAKTLTEKGYNIYPLPETRFISFVKSNDVITIGETRLGKIKIQGISYQNVKDVGKINVGQGYGFNIIKGRTEAFQILSKNIPQANSYIKYKIPIDTLSKSGRINIGRGIVSKTLTRDIGTNPIQVRYRKTIGSIFETGQENVFGYVGSKDFIKIKTPTGIKYKFDYPELKGYVFVMEDKGINYIGGISPIQKQTIAFSLKGITPLADRQTASLLKITSMSYTQPKSFIPTSVTSSSIIKQNIQLKQKDIVSPKFKTNFMQGEGQGQTPLFKIDVKLSQKLSPKEIFKFRDSLGNAEIQKASQLPKLKLGEGTPSRLRTPQIQRPDFIPPKSRTPPFKPRNKFPFFPKVPNILPMKFKYRQPVQRKRKGFSEGVFYIPSFTSRVLNIKTPVPKNYKGGGFIRGIPKF